MKRRICFTKYAAQIGVFCLLATVFLLVIQGQKFENFWKGSAAFLTQTFTRAREGGLNVLLKPVQGTLIFNQSVYFTDLCTERDVPDVGAMQSTDFSVPIRQVQATNFTLVMVTHKRDDMMRKCLRQFSQMSRIGKIILYWNNPGRQPPDLKAEISFRMPIVVKNVNFTTLRSRFIPVPEIETEAVFIVDDDLLIGEEGINKAFDVWKGHPWGIVGFTWRHYSTKNDGSREYSLHISDRYSMILTNAALMHREYLRLYTEAMPTAMAKIVDDSFNCDDLAMNFLVSHHCRCSSAYKVEPSLFKMLSSSGISTQSGHMAVRHMCMTKFSRLYTDIPLISKPSSCRWRPRKS